MQNNPLPANITTPLIQKKLFQYSTTKNKQLIFTHFGTGVEFLVLQTTHSKTVYRRRYGILVFSLNDEEPCSNIALISSAIIAWVVALSCYISRMRYACEKADFGHSESQNP